MIFDANLAKAVADLQKSGKLPRGLSRAQITQLARALQKYSSQVGERVIKRILDDWKSKIETAQSLVAPETMRGPLADLTPLVGSEEIADRVRFALKISQEVASGAGQYLNQNLSPEVVDEYPALEFKRLFARDVPRGERRGSKGALIPVPDDNWPSRWQAAGEAVEDEDWLPWEGDAQTGRGVALKSSRIWQALGDGEGGYTDTLGNPFAPFAFNSGFMTFDVSRSETEKLGLLDKGEAAKPAQIDFSKLISFTE